MLCEVLILGIQYLSDGGPLTIETQEMSYEFKIDDNTIDATPSVSVSAAEPTGLSADGGETTGTSVSVQFGDDGLEMLSLGYINRTLVGFTALNPHVTFELSGFETPASKDTTTRYEPNGNATTGRVSWFDSNAFEERVKTDIQTAPELSVEEFIGGFDGLAGRTKRGSVVDSLSVEVDREIGQTFTATGDTLNDGLVDEFQTAMRQETTTRSKDNLDSTLGSIGEALRHGLVAFLDYIGGHDTGRLVDDLRADGADVSDWWDLVTYYCSSDAVERDTYRIPYVFELAALPLDQAEPYSFFGISGLVSYSQPQASVNYTDTNQDEQYYTSIKSAFDELSHDFVVVSNLTCPNIPFQDKGKQNFPAEPCEDTISDVVWKTVRKYQRNIRPMLNSLEESAKLEKPTLDDSRKAHQGFIKEAGFELFDGVYREATESGGYLITMRTFFYLMRPKFDNLAERRGYEFTHTSTYEDRTPLELNYGTFTDCVDKYEHEEFGKRVVRRNDRGFFIEPHSNRRIELSTKKVESYDPVDAVGTVYDTLLFVEKTGFYEQLHRDFEITKRDDVGLINSQGYSTTAIRSLVEEVQKEAPDAQYLALMDLDVSGLGIATDADTPDALSALSTFDATRLGVTVDDAQEFDLAVEDVNYNQKELTKLETHHDDGDISDDTYQFVSEGNRVEINAFAPTELKDYVEQKLDTHGVTKIEPDPEEIDTSDIDSWEDTREDAVRKAVGAYVGEQIDDKLIEIFAEYDDNVELPQDEDRSDVDTSRETVHEQLLERLGDKPPESWESVNEDVNDDISDDVTDAQEEYAETVEDAVKDVLTERDIISVDPGSDD